MTCPECQGEGIKGLFDVCSECSGTGTVLSCTDPPAEKPEPKKRAARPSPQQLMAYDAPPIDLVEEPKPTRRAKPLPPLELPPTPGPFKTIHEALAFFGHSSFRDGQQDAIESVLTNRATVFLAPTGRGKSIVFQLPALMFDGLTLVVSPLISLMRDQVASLLARGIPAAALTSESTQRQQAQIIDAIPRLKLLYVAPERLNNEDFVIAMSGITISLLTVDESHCCPAGTLVQTYTGEVPIERLEPGQLVLSMRTDGQLEWRHIRQVIARLAKVVFDIGFDSLDTVAATDEHPFFVEGVGYLPTVDLRPGDVVLRVKPDVLPAVQPRTDTIVNLSPVLLQSMLVCESESRSSGATSSEMCSVRPSFYRAPGSEGDEPFLFAKVSSGGTRPTETGGASLPSLLDNLCRQGLLAPEILLGCVWAQSERGTFVGTHDAQQSREVAARTRIALAALEGHRQIWRDETWWQWETSTAASAGTSWTFSRPISTTGAAHRDGTAPVGRHSDGLQSGYRVSESTVSRRDRWGVPSVNQDTGEGPAEGFRLVRDRVASVALQKQTRSPQSNGSGAGDTSSAVFNLEVDGPNNFFANGVLTHNCISSFGHDFRPKYRLIGYLMKQHRPERILAVTASAPPATLADIQKQLMIHDAKVFSCGFERPNLAYEVVRIPANEKEFSKTQHIANLARQVLRGGVLIYTMSIKRAEAIAVQLQARGIPCQPYHSKLKKEPKETTERDFLEGRLHCVAATCAFGMGVDRPDVRLVIHDVLPGSVEAYYQEAGRAGRDGQPARCIVLYHSYDVGSRRWLIEQTSSNPESIGRQKKLLDLLQEVIENPASRCRARLIREYFGERAITPCGRCDVCRRAGVERNG